MFESCSFCFKSLTALQPSGLQLVGSRLVFDGSDNCGMGFKVNKTSGWIWWLWTQISWTLSFAWLFMVMVGWCWDFSGFDNGCWQTWKSISLNIWELNRRNGSGWISPTFPVLMPLQSLDQLLVDGTSKMTEIYYRQQKLLDFLAGSQVPPTKDLKKDFGINLSTSNMDFPPVSLPNRSKWLAAFAAEIPRLWHWNPGRSAFFQKIHGADQQNRYRIRSSPVSCCNVAKKKRNSQSSENNLIGFANRHGNSGPQTNSSPWCQAACWQTGPR